MGNPLKISFTDLAFTVACICVSLAAISQLMDRRQPSEARIRVGDQISVEGIDFAKSRRTLLIVYNTNCAYCQRSLAFYQRLLASGFRSAKNSRVVAVGAQSRETLVKHFAENQIAVDDVVSLPAAALPSHLTPSLILVDQARLVKAVWLGLQSPRGETAIMQTMKSGN